MHAKFAVFDDAEAIVGSYNLDPRSERLNSETAIAIRSAPLARELARWFSQEYVAKSREVTASEASSYSRPGDLAHAFSLAFSLPVRDWL